LTSALDGGELSASQPGRFTPVNIAPSTHWIGGWAGPRAGMDGMDAAKKSLSPHARNRAPAVQPVAISTELSGSLAYRYMI
jgi:hypothetical protein